ncbi:MAG: choice-of-anchor J domain-containing protein, partial [Pseudomonadota bacterium]
NFFVDLVSVNSPAPPEPSVCTAVPCGNVILDDGEQCDDGNTLDGDGCDQFCQVEAGFECTAPLPGVTDGDAIGDGGFELPGENAQTTNPFWSETGTVFTPLCNAASCGAFLGNEGEGFAWFGGTDVPNVQSLEQTVTIPVDVTFFDFGLLVAGGGADGACDGPDDAMRILIDGNVVFETPNPCVPSAGGIGNYPVNTVDLTAGGYNDGGSHTLRIEGEIFAANGANTNFLLDSMTAPFVLDPPLPPTPSQCTLLPQTCYLEDFADAGAGSLADWTLFNDGEQAADWGTTDDGVCGTGNVGPGNFSGGSGEAACIDSDALGSPAVNAWLCSPQIPLEGSESTLDFLYSYHPFLEPGVDDAFEVLIGTDAPSLGTVGAYTSLFFTQSSQGTLIGLPGAKASLDITAFEGSAVHVCFRYGANFDWYAHLDDVAVRAAACFPDSDGDGITDDVDNCTLTPNPLQIDSNGDNIGNVCDADIAGPAGAGLDDCQVAFFDLGRIKEVFFTTNADADLVGPGLTEPDGQVNFFDLARMKETFFAQPGPSATGCDQDQ